MDFTIFITLFHIIGVALGVGGATISDLLFFKSLKDRRVSKDEFAMLHTLGYVLWVGLIILFLSGLGFVLTQLWLTGSSTYLMSAWFWAKMTIVFTLFCNALMMHSKVFPFMTAHLDSRLEYEDVKDHLVLLSATGVVSIASWYSAMILGVTRGFDFSYLFIINAYVVVLATGMLVAYLLLQIAVFPPPEKTVKRSPARSVPAHVSQPNTTSYALLIKVFLGALVLGGVIVSLVWYASNPAKQPQTEGAPTVVGTEHVVCISEFAPWFLPAVVKIEVGDTVTWSHCHTNEEVGASAVPISIRFARTALAHGGEDHGVGSHDGYVHTHPIYSLSGPVSFSSNFRPIGHAENGDGFSFTFTEAGVYEYICPTHPYMKGSIAVGTSTPIHSLWPPEEQIDPTVGVPTVPGVGEVWVDTQFAEIAGQTYPGSITIVDTAIWEVTDVVTDESFNNPHNVWRAPAGEYMYQTQWHSNVLSILDVASKEVVRTIELGNAPAHVVTHPTRDLVYVTLNNENRIAVLDGSGKHLRDIVVPFGPHGVWVSPDGSTMSVASTLAEELTIIDLESETIRTVIEASGLPLATAITNDGRYAMISRMLENSVRFVDLATLEVVADVPVGSLPIWPAPAPDGRHVYVPNSGSASISVIDLETLTVVKTIAVAAGAHGITFGPKADGGYYGYVSHKFARVMGVIDIATQELVGHVPLGEAGWGGNGIIAIEHSYDEAVRQLTTE